MARNKGSSEGRADGAPEFVFEDQETSISDISWVDAPGILMFWLLAVIVFLQFFTRYVLNDSLSWTEETARYFLILVCFLGSVSAMRRGSHIMIEFFIRALPPRIGKALAVISQFITCGFLVAMTWIGVELTQKTRQKMISLPVPKSWIYWVCVVALGAMAIYAAIWLWRRIRSTPAEIVASIEENFTSD